MTSVEKRIENMLLRYLKAEHGITANAARFGDTDSALNDGCDTCGHGSTEMSFDIQYSAKGQTYYRTLSIDGDPLNFLPKLLKYDVED